MLLGRECQWESRPDNERLPILLPGILTLVCLIIVSNTRMLFSEISTQHALIGYNTHRGSQGAERRGAEAGKFICNFSTEMTEKRLKIVVVLASSFDKAMWFNEANST